MIKPGTMCIVVDSSWQLHTGKVCTVTAPPERHPLGLYYPTDIGDALGFEVAFRADCLRPLDDPDQWAKDPAYTKRPEQVPA